MRLAAFLCLLALRAQGGSPEDCAPCHRKETARFADAGMTRALQPGGGNRRLQTRLGLYSYEVNGSDYTVSDGTGILKFPLAWTFGQGSTGQTWLYQRDNRWYESRASYYGTLGALDLTIGQQSITPHSLAEAAGRLIPVSEARQCFSCHSTGPLAGIQCERCHGASEAHLSDPAKLPRKLARLTTEEQSDFCGECHRTWAEISLKGPRGIQNVRFQPYRLAGSKCYDATDARIRCTACHDPHAPLETNEANYDARCLACHAQRSTNACPIAKKLCVSCHMPKLDLPGAHKSFTDHRIRIVKANESYPD